MNYCCNGCDRRFPGCHGSCKTYQDEKANEDALKAAERSRTNGARMVMEMRSRAVERAMRDKIKKGKPWR